MPTTAIPLSPPMISNLALTLDKDIANAKVEVKYNINWSAFDQLTNLSYTEAWSLVALDGVTKTTLYTGPTLISGVSFNGSATTARTKTATIPWSDLDEDVNDDDEIAAVVTLTPKLPTTRTAQSATVVVNAP